MVKNPPANGGDQGEGVPFQGQEDPLGEGNGNPLQYSCLENPMDREAWQGRQRSPWGHKELDTTDVT